MRYLQVTVTTTTFGSDIVSYIMEECGSEGVNIIDINDIRAVLTAKECWDYVDESILSYNDERVFVKGFFDEDFDVSVILEKLDQLRANAFEPVGSLELSTDKIDSQDWENEWRKYYVPIEINNVVIVPAWLKYEGDIKTQILIEPGMAFGTGNHETTGMCIALMQDFKLDGKLVADVGCGSGILGVAALKLGAGKCFFNDIDELAIKATEQNLELNGIDGGYEVVCGDLVLGEEKADVVIANITADILIRLCEKLTSYVKDGGVVIVSGIINARADDVKNAYCKYFDEIRTEKKGEWQAMSFRKRI